MTRLSVIAIVLLFSALAALNACYADDAGDNATSCTAVANDLGGCLTFIQGKEDKPSQKCCDGAKQLNDTAKTKADRQAICECIKKALSAVGKIDTSRIPLLAKDCKISVKLPAIGPDTDCTK
ncbi:hypothetical protein SLA2020_439570 [Shorea laevis]